MAPKKNRKQAQDSLLEEPIEDWVVPLESIGEEEPRTREDQDEPESEEEQRSSVLFTSEQLEVLLKMNRPNFGELMAALKTGTSKEKGIMQMQFRKMTSNTRNVIHFDNIFATTMRLVSKPTDFTTSNVLVLHVHVVTTCCSCICNYSKGWTKF
jgi:hypothetical protein